jgi:hypothetical protein
MTTILGSQGDRAFALASAPTLGRVIEFGSVQSRAVFDRLRPRACAARITTAGSDTAILGQQRSERSVRRAKETPRTVTSMSRSVDGLLLNTVWSWLRRLGVLYARPNVFITRTVGGTTTGWRIWNCGLPTILPGSESKTWLSSLAALWRPMVLR